MGSGDEKQLLSSIFLHLFLKNQDVKKVLFSGLATLCVPLIDKQV